jgi:integrase
LYPLSLLKRGPRTINKARDRLLALARFAHAKHLLDEVPDVLPLPEPRQIPQAYTPDEVAALLGACREHAGSYAGIPAGLYWFAVGQLLYWTGLRSGVLWKMARKQVDIERATVFVPAEHQKQNADQLLRIHADCVDAMGAIWQPDRHLLFPWPYMCLETRYNHWDRILRRAGLPLVKRNKFKMLRKTCATLCRANGADATTQLGHSSDAITRRHYLAPGMELQAADVLPRPKVSNGQRQLTLF